MTEQSSYKGIFKSTILFSFVKVFQILAGIIKNKVIAVLLGPEGVGIIGILSSSISLLQAGAGLGINQSAVRDISDANGCGDKTRFSRIISLTTKVILFTCLLGCLVTIVLSPLLSKWTFGTNNYTFAYLWLGLVVGLNIITEGQLGILKGMRQLNALAKASMIGSLVGLVTAVPIYYFFGKSGIVPSLIITAISAVFFSNYFVRKIKYDKTKLSLKEISSEASSMVKMGVALMFVGFLGLLFDLIVASYIRSHGGLEVVGFYRAGTTIITSYFGIVLTSMTTDYYPRISAVHNDNIKLQEELNKQSEVGLILIFPIGVLFVYLAPIIIQILYSKVFIQSISYIDYAMFGTIIVVCSNNMGMILLAKQAAKIFTIYSFINQFLFVVIYIVSYNLYGLSGLGITYTLNVILQLIAMSLVNRYIYNIKFENKLYIHLIVVLSTVLITVLLRKIDIISLRYFLGFCVFVFSCLYSYKYMKKMMNMNFWEYLIRKRNETNNNENN
jgi:PST family polysaccharide transporter